MKTQERNDRNAVPRGRRIRIQINAPAQSRRRVESAWKEEARAVLAARPVDERIPSVAELEIASALRQPRLWDVRTEPRSVSLGFGEDAVGFTVPAPAERPARTPIVSGRRKAHPWLWWEFVAPVAISLGAIWQLIWAIR